MFKPEDITGLWHKAAVAGVLTSRHRQGLLVCLLFFYPFFFPQEEPHFTTDRIQTNSSNSEKYSLSGLIGWTRRVGISHVPRPPFYLCFPCQVQCCRGKLILWFKFCRSSRNIRNPIILFFKYCVAVHSPSDLEVRTHDGFSLCFLNFPRFSTFAFTTNILLSFYCCCCEGEWVGGWALHGQSRIPNLFPLVS